ncbi:hypothetical protein HPB47_004505 [Ixodes persulcatus]|uniref:Uncharacterized protein n=1 Tax=Ixodes persulcatus TaxID=34615 RepID=A0AC60PH29_IXOPE|nr:hypothetical protein HPB47_004505 [Ixodes persulcatus]
MSGRLAAATAADKRGALGDVLVRCVLRDRLSLTPFAICLPRAPSAARTFSIEAAGPGLRRESGRSSPPEEKQQPTTPPRRLINEPARSAIQLGQDSPRGGIAAAIADELSAVRRSLVAPHGSITRRHYR